MLMNKQLEYLTPEVNVFTVQTEGVICQSGLGAPGAAGLGFTDGGNINDYTGFDF